MRGLFSHFHLTLFHLIEHFTFTKQQNPDFKQFDYMEITRYKTWQHTTS